MLFDQTGLPWINPSPNMRSLNAALLYPGIGLLEFSVSVGRGTDTPFEILGAPYVNDLRLSYELNKLGLPGVQFTPVRFTPTTSIFKNESCGGVRIVITDRVALRPVQTGIAIVCTVLTTTLSEVVRAGAGEHAAQSQGQPQTHPRRRTVEEGDRSVERRDGRSRMFLSDEATFGYLSDMKPDVSLPLAERMSSRTCWRTRFQDRFVAEPLLKTTGKGHRRRGIEAELSKRRVRYMGDGGAAERRALENVLHKPT
jgi:hypothetical protein